MLRGVSILCAVAAVGLLGWGAYSAFHARPGPDPVCFVTPTEYELGTVPVGDRVVTFAITNPAGKPRQIVGLAEGCWASVCFSSKHPDQITIPAGETFHYECELSIKEAGPFSAQVEIYLEEDGLRTVPLTVRGTAVAPRGESHASPPKP